MLIDSLRASLADRYTIEREVGQGGMATVYLAEDVKHHRKVAVKVLRPELAAVIGADRFLVEIRTTANLQHPHILPLHDSGEVDGTVFYVMPFVAGESLRDRLDREKQLPVADAVRIASEVASALDYAHRHDVIHRDIKPENILLHDGQALVADFGIALAASKGEGSSRMTETGMSLGTPTYMSPEQAMGERDLDGRTDVYALGCMLYEMLAGEPPFTGPTAQAIVAKVMSSEPEPVTTLRGVVPSGVAVAVHTALQKLPVDRFPTAAAFAEALSRPSSHQFTVGPIRTGVLPGMSVTASRVAFGILAALAAVATWSALRSTSEANEIRTTRMAIDLPEGQGLLAPGGIRVSFAPDGESFYYLGPGPTRPMVWRRSFDQLEATQVAGTEGATSATVSPDGSQLAFVTLSPFTLQVVKSEGSPPRTVVSDSISGGGVAWSSDGFIYFDGNTGLARIRPDGTDRSAVMPLDAALGESGVAWPEALPDGRGVVVRVRRGGEEMSAYRIVAYDARDGSRKDLVTAVVARYSPTGHLLYVTAVGELFAQRFDLKRLELRGRPLMIWDGVRVGGFGATDLAISSAGDLMYTGGRIRNAIAELVWVDRTGQAAPVDSTVEGGLIRDVALSPDGTAIAMEVLRPTGTSDVPRIYIKRLGGGPTQLISSELTRASEPVWLPTGQEVMYQSEGVGLVRRRADASGAAELVIGNRMRIMDVAVGPVGSTLVMQGESEFSDRDLVDFRVGIDSIPRPLFSEANVETEPAFSPDGQWLAYSSSESGRPEVYLRPYPDVESMKVQLSTDGGRRPKWNRLGDELFYLDANGDMIAISLRPSGRRDVISRTRLFSASGYQSREGVSYYDVTPDGERFLMLDIGINSVAAGTEPLVIVQNFLAELAAMEFPE
jgi:serine/threonine-protein kinase